MRPRHYSVLENMEKISLTTIQIFLFLGLFSVGFCVEEIPLPPKPYAFSYAAGRAPGHTDRVHAEVGDGTGVVRGMFSYVDPSYKVRTVEYVADDQGFHPLHITNPNTDTKAVALEKLKHAALYEKISEEQQRIALERGQTGFDDGSYKPQSDEFITPVHTPIEHPKDTEAVNRAKFRHYNLYDKIAQDHAQIAAQREFEKAELQY